MEFNIKELNPSDYEDVLVGWWKDWDWQPPPKDFLPNDGVGGVMVTHNDQPICAGFMLLNKGKSAVCLIFNFTELFMTAVF